MPSFLRRLFNNDKKKSAETANWVTLYPTDVVEKNLLLNNKEWVFIAVDKVAKAVSAVRFKVMQYKANGDDREVFNGPLVDFLENPARDLTGKDFIYLDTAYKELTGNAFWERDGRYLSPLIPTCIRPVMSGARVTGYKYQDGPVERTIPLSKVLHDRYIDPRKPHWGVGKLAKISRWVDTSSYANEFLRLFFVNGAQFGGFITTEEETEERIKLIKAGLANEHTGVENAHKIAVLPKGSDFKEATASMNDMQFRELDDDYRDKILSAFGVPKTLVGFTTEVNRASAEASEYIFAKYTIKPVVEDFVEFLNTTVVPLYDSSGKLYFSYDEFVPENMEMKLKEREIALNKQPYMTVNEVRASVGLPPVAGGDVVYGSPLQVPLGEPQASPDLLPSPSDDEDDQEPKKAAPARVRFAEKKERFVDDLAKRVAEVASQHHDPDAEAHKAFVGRVEAHEKLVADKVRDFNGRQERQVLEDLVRITKAVAKGDLFDMDGEVSILVDFISPLLKGLVIEQALEEFAAQGYPGSFDTEKASIPRIVDLAARRLAKSYNNTTAKLLKQALNEGIQGGEDIRQLTDRVRSVYEFSNTYRAEAVAKTETFYIANEASREAYRQSGVVQSVRWYTAEDELVCPFCGPQNGKIIGINEVFFKKGEVLEASGQKLKLNYRTIDVPPLHTNCRCFIRPEGIDIG